VKSQPPISVRGQDNDEPSALDRLKPNLGRAEPEVRGGALLGAEIVGMGRLAQDVFPGDFSENKTHRLGHRRVFAHGTPHFRYFSPLDGDFKAQALFGLWPWFKEMEDAFGDIGLIAQRLRKERRGFVNLLDDRDRRINRATICCTRTLLIGE
jgi:hypothetical protein